MDRYSRAVLTIIAAALIGVNVQWLRHALSPSIAHAADRNRYRCSWCKCRTMPRAAWRATSGFRTVILVPASRSGR